MSSTATNNVNAGPEFWLTGLISQTRRSWYASVECC